MKFKKWRLSCSSMLFYHNWKRN